MRTALRWTICILIGLALGAGIAVWRVRSGALGSVDRLGAWTTGSDFGTAKASALTRAVIALRGLLALPASEARYYNAAVDDDGRPLNGHCRYRVSGAAFAARWWSLTLYDGAGYLVRNDAGIYSVNGGRMADPAHWEVIVAPDRPPGSWLPTGGIERFELTLRTYLPKSGTLPADRLPRIERLDCA